MDRSSGRREDRLTVPSGIGLRPSGGDGFESGVDAESPKEEADVVLDRRGAQVEFGGDLLRRAALHQKTKHLDLTRGEMRGWRCGPVVGVFLEQPEDADHPFAALERHRADLHSHPCAGGRNKDAGRVCGLRAEHLLGEQLAGAFPALGRDDGGELTTANVADEPLGCRIELADDSLCVEDVARDADTLKSLLDVAADFQASGHHGSVADRGCVAPLVQLASRARRPSSTTRRSASKDRGVATVRTKPRGPHDVVSLTR